MSKKEILKQLFLMESEAYIKYQFFANQAKKDGYEQIAAIFEETAKNEKEHAELWYKELYGGKINPTTFNLDESIENENYESTKTYNHYAELLEKINEPKLAKKCRQIANIEGYHSKRFKKLKYNIENNEVFKKNQVTIWKCRNCGNIVISDKAPEKCPVCNHEQAYYELQEDNY